MALESAQWWQRPFAELPEPHAIVPLAAGVLALVIVLSRHPWSWARHVLTLVHEGGHALTALLAGRRLQGIRLHSDTSGLTFSRGKRTGPGVSFTLFAGYPAPALLGLAFAGLIALDQTATILLVSAVGVVGVLVMVRNVYGAVIVLLVAAVLAVVAFLGTPDVVAAFVYAITWLLLLGSIRPVIELQRQRRRNGAPHSDVDQLAGLTGLPAGLWILLLVLLTLLCAAIGGAWLLEPALPLLT